MTTKDDEPTKPTPTIDLCDIYNRIVKRLTANGEKDAEKQAADAIEQIAEMDKPA